MKIKCIMNKYVTLGISTIIAATVTACAGAGPQDSTETDPTSNVTESISGASDQTEGSSAGTGALENAIENLPDKLEEDEMVMIDYDFTEAGIAGKLPDAQVQLGELKGKNPDACAYIVVPGTGISDVILKKADSNEYYLEHSADGESDPKGAICMDMGNTEDFTDPVTCIYARSGENGPFSELVNYLDPGFTKNNEFIYVYSDDCVNEYRVFAAYNTEDTERLLVKYNFYDYNEYQSYINEILSIRDISAVLNADLKDQALSTWNTLTLVGIDDDGSRQIVQAVFSGRTEY